jgi:hypothetical protein
LSGSKSKAGPVKLSPSPETHEARSPWLGIRLPLDVVIAPARAFPEIAASREWLTAYALIVASGLAAVAWSAPALRHLAGVVHPPFGAAGRPAAEIVEAGNALIADAALQQLLTPLFAIGLTAMVLTTIARFKGQATPFRVYLALATNCLVPTIFGNLVTGAAVALHPAASYHDLRAFNVAAPDNLALFASSTNPKEVGFLGSFDIFTLWSTILLAFGFAATTPVKVSTALAVSFSITLALATYFTFSS